jgi:hypothetical protein
MNFSIVTPSAATWNGWIASKNLLLPLWLQAQPVTDPAVNLKKAYALGRSGVVGVLSTLTTPGQGITCSSWQLVDTGQ